MNAVLDMLDTALQAGQAVYLHCWAGIGRTGTVVGCYLVRHGLTGEQALARLVTLRAGLGDAADARRVLPAIRPAQRVGPERPTKPARCCPRHLIFSD